VKPPRREKDSKETQASAYSYSAGNDPGGWGDAFTWYNAEASASSGYNGVYYNDGERMIFGDLLGVAASAD
jgi:hypothetical protein